MGERIDVAESGAANVSGIATPMKIGAAVVVVLRLVTLIVASYILVQSKADDLVEAAFGGDPALFQILMIVGAWFAAAVSVAHLVALRADSRRRIVITALLTIASVLVFAAIRGWGLKGLLQPLEVASLFSSLFILRMVVADRTE